MSYLRRFASWWLSTLRNRESLLGKAIVAGISLFLLCFVCSIPVAIITPAPTPTPPAVAEGDTSDAGQSPEGTSIPAATITVTPTEMPNIEATLTTVPSPVATTAATVTPVSTASDGETAVTTPTAVPATSTPQPSPTPMPPTTTPVPANAAPRSPGAAEVVEVVDGDTIDVLIDGQPYTVRYIGIDTPERGETGYDEATQANAELVAGQEVWLEKDVSETDQYDRLLRYVYVGETMVNAELVRQGYAQAVTYQPDVAHAETFRQLEQQARAEGAGLWASAEPTPAPAPSGDNGSGSIVVAPSCSQFDAPGNDNETKTEEYVCFVNQGDAGVDMAGWRVVDEADHTYTFPSFRLAPGATVRIRTGCGSNTQTDLFWCYDRSAVWNNGGDTVFLYDANGALVVQYGY